MRPVCPIHTHDQSRCPKGCPLLRSFPHDGDVWKFLAISQVYKRGNLEKFLKKLRVGERALHIEEVLECALKQLQKPIMLPSKDHLISQMKDWQIEKSRVEPDEVWVRVRGVGFVDEYDDVGDQPDPLVGEFEQALCVMCRRIDKKGGCIDNCPFLQTVNQANAWKYLAVSKVYKRSNVVAFLSPLAPLDRAAQIEVLLVSALRELQRPILRPSKTELIKLLRRRREPLNVIDRVEGLVAPAPAGEDLPALLVNFQDEPAAEVVDGPNGPQVPPPPAADVVIEGPEDELAEVEADEDLLGAQSLIDFHQHLAAAVDVVPPDVMIEGQQTRTGRNVRKRSGQNIRNVKHRTN